MVVGIQENITTLSPSVLYCNTNDNGKYDKNHKGAQTICNKTFLLKNLHITNCIEFTIVANIITE